MIPQIAKFMGPTWRPPGSCRPQMGPMLAPWTLLSGTCNFHLILWLHAQNIDPQAMLFSQHERPGCTCSRVLSYNYVTEMNSFVPGTLPWPKIPQEACTLIHPKLWCVGSHYKFANSRSSISFIPAQVVQFRLIHQLLESACLKK